MLDVPSLTLYCRLVGAVRILWSDLPQRGGIWRGAGWRTIGIAVVLMLAAFVVQATLADRVDHHS